MGYCGKLDAPGTEHINLPGHAGEVLDVDWCPSEEGKVRDPVFK